MKKRIIIIGGKTEGGVVRMGGEEIEGGAEVTDEKKERLSVWHKKTQKMEMWLLHRIVGDLNPESFTLQEVVDGYNHEEWPIAGESRRTIEESKQERARARIIWEKWDLEKLVSEGFLEKNEDGFYCVTNKGKLFAEGYETLTDSGKTRINGKRMKNPIAEKDEEREDYTYNPGSRRE